MGRLTYAVHSAVQVLARQSKRCLYCQSDRTTLRSRKHLLWHLRRCDECRLQFRWPNESRETASRYYQKTHSDGVVYQLPDEASLTAIRANGFRSDSLDYSGRIAVIRSLRPQGSLLDYGASWGYGVFQFRQAGYDAMGVEVSQPRAAYGREKLGVRIETDSRAYPDKSFDIIHTAHVLEHIPDLHVPFGEFRRLLKPGGQLVIFVPNGGGNEAQSRGVRWSTLINEKHVLALTAEFFAGSLPSYGFGLTFGSSPYSEPLRGFTDHPVLDGEELLVVGILGP